MVNESVSSSNSNLPAEDQSNKKSRQTTIVEANQNAWNHLFLDKLAVCFVSSSWAYLTADQSWFTEMLEAYRYADIECPGRDAIPGLIVTKRDDLKRRLINRLQTDSVEHPVTIAFDAWNNVNRMHVTNFMLLCNAKQYSTFDSFFRTIQPCHQHRASRSGRHA